MKISAILRKAANEHLWHPDMGNIASGQSSYCCHAVFEAQGMVTYPNRGADPTEQFMAERGLILSGGGFEFPNNDPRHESEDRGRMPVHWQQEVRYAWLMFCADLAEEEGL